MHWWHFWWEIKNSWCIFEDLWRKICTNYWFYIDIYVYDWENLVLINTKLKFWNPIKKVRDWDFLINLYSPKSWWSSVEHGFTFHILCGHYPRNSPFGKKTCALQCDERITMYMRFWRKQHPNLIIRTIDLGVQWGSHKWHFL